jgi:hypothetical protein
MAALPNIVLVHGAWADGSCWSGVIERLQADGYKVTAPQLPETSLAPPEVSLPVGFTTFPGEIWGTPIVGSRTHTPTSPTSMRSTGGGPQ